MECSKAMARAVLETVDRRGGETVSDSGHGPGNPDDPLETILESSILHTEFL